MNLLRDSAQLQTHLRLFENAVETRHTILRLRPNQRQNWMALAVAHHLNGNMEEAKLVLESYFRSLKDVFWKNWRTLRRLFQSSMKTKDHDPSSTDKLFSRREVGIVFYLSLTYIRVHSARLLTKHGSPDAKEAWCALIEYNPNSYDAYRGYLENAGLSFGMPFRFSITRFLFLQRCPTNKRLRY